MSLRSRFLATDFYQVFNSRTEKGEGACLLLANTFTTNIAAALVGGVFYSSFMALNGIDIVRIGILGTIPSVCWLFSLFTPKIMRRFRSRRYILFAAHMVNFLCTVLGTTIMPWFVKDYTMRAIWFGVFLLIGNLVNALFNSGATPWHLHFLPASDQLRNVYYSYHNILGALIGTVTNITAALVADTLDGMPQELTIINILRLVAFAFYIISGVLSFLLPKEYPYDCSNKDVHLLDTVRLPFKERKYLLTASVIFLWTFTTSCNSSTWFYYLKEDVGVSYFVMQLSGIVTMVSNFLLLPWFRRLVDRYTMPTMLRYGILGLACCQFLVGFVAPGGAVYYAITMIPNGIFWSLVNLCVSNAFIYNLPGHDRDVHTIFWNLMVQVATFLGVSFGAWFLGILGEGVLFRIFHLEVYGSQMLMWFKFAVNTCISLYIAKITPWIRHGQALNDKANLQR